MIVCFIPANKQKRAHARNLTANDPQNPPKESKTQSFSWDVTCAICNEEKSVYFEESDEPDIWVDCAKTKCPLRFHSFCTPDLRFMNEEAVYLRL
jgi:hypothetical protein